MNLVIEVTILIDILFLKSKLHIIYDFPKHKVPEYKIEDLLHLNIHYIVAIFQKVSVCVHQHFLQRVLLVYLLSILFTLEKYDAEGNVAKDS